MFGERLAWKKHQNFHSDTLTLYQGEYLSAFNLKTSETKVGNLDPLALIRT